MLTGNFYGVMSGHRRRERNEENEMGEYDSRLAWMVVAIVIIAIVVAEMV